MFSGKTYSFPFVQLVPWPNAGEIDILEGVNDQGPNHSTLHTTEGCTMSENDMVQTG
jgi:hypothetical protein